MNALCIVPTGSSTAKGKSRLPLAAATVLSLLWLVIAGGEAMAAGPNAQIPDAAAYSPIVKAAAFGCTLSNGQLICGIVKSNKNTNTNMNTNPDQQGGVQMEGQSPCLPAGAAGLAQSKTPCQQGGAQNNDVGSQGERSCPTGYVVLDKPNKYGAYCEPKEGFPAQAGGGDNQGSGGGVAQKICCTAHLHDGASGGQCTTDYNQTEAEVRKDLQHFADINNDPSASITCQAQ